MSDDRWASELENITDVMGRDITDQQAENLESWVLENVPRNYWRSAADWLPSKAAQKIYMRCGESCC